MGSTTRLLSSLLLTSSPLRLRPTAAAAALFLCPPAAASRRLLLLSPPYPLRSLSTSSAAAAASLPHGGSSASPAPAPPPRAPFPEWSRLVDRLADAGYASRAPCPADELAATPASDGAEAAVFSCLAFARDRPDLLRSLPRKDVEVLVANATPALFKDGDASAQRLQRYLAGEESDDMVSGRAETVDVIRYLLSYTYSSSDSYSEDKELTDLAVKNILAELVSFSGLSQSSSFVESTPRQPSSQHERFSRPPGQHIEMKRGDWICTRCSFMNFARNARCLECNEHRPKKMLTGGEWECPQCDFHNYGRNMSCLKCDCKRPATIPLSPASADDGLGRVAQLLSIPNAGKSEIERKLAENDEKAERWLSKVSQLDDSADLSSLAEDEDFPEIMPMRKGVNKFVVSTRKTPLERRLANAQYSSNNSPQAASSDSKISQTLDRILGRSTSTAAPNNQSDAGGPTGEAPKKLSDHLGGLDPVPFVPLPADMFAKPQSKNAQRNEDGQINAEPYSPTVNRNVQLPERRDGVESLDTAEKWSKKVAEDIPSATSDEYLPEIMPMRKGENRFVVSKKKDRSLTSPQYKRRSVLELADNSDFVPFVPFPPGYFDKKDKPGESIAESGMVRDGSAASEKHSEPNASSGKLGNNSNTSQVVLGQPKDNMNNGNWNGTYSQQNLSSGGYTYGESYSHQHQSQSHEAQSRSSRSSNPGTWNTDYSQGTFNESRGESTYYGANSAQQPYNSGYANNNSWRNENNSSNSVWNGNNNYNNNNAWSTDNTYNNSSSWSGNSIYNNNTWSNNPGYNNSGAWSNSRQSAWSSNISNNQSGSFTNNSSAASSSGSMNPNHTVHNSGYAGTTSRGYTGKSLEGSAVRDPDPLDMSEEAKAERWFRRAAQIKDISELANIPDEDFPEIMPMRKGVNRFVVSKRKTPLERRLTSSQYRRNLPIVGSEPEKDSS